MKVILFIKYLRDTSNFLLYKLEQCSGLALHRLHEIYSFSHIISRTFQWVFRYWKTFKKLSPGSPANEFSCHRESFCSKSFILAGLLILLVRFLQSVTLKRLKSQFLCFWGCRIQIWHYFSCTTYLSIAINQYNFFFFPTILLLSII